MRSSRFMLCLGIGITLLGCSEEKSSSSTNTGVDPSMGNDGDGSDGDGSDGDSDGSSNDDGSDPSDGASGGCANPGANEDLDNDGFTPSTGDCNECSATINPGAYDFPGNEHDEDCSGTPADAAEYECDMGLNMASNEAKDAARAMGLCKFVGEDEPGWGVISARFTNATGDGDMEDPKQVGLLPEFGAAQPRAGASMFALSSGIARAPGQSGYTQECDSFLNLPDPLSFECLLNPQQCLADLEEILSQNGQEPPAGYPKNSSGCGDQFGGEPVQIFNQAALELKIRVPTNANSYAFDSIFYTYEYPAYVCDRFNDFFVVFQSPKPAELEDENLVFDSNGDPIGVNSGLLAVCNADDDEAGGKTFACEQGTGLLAGTGFGAGESSCGQEGPETPEGVGGASTGWLRTTAPVQPNTVITVRFALWDTGDPILDSTVLVDKFEWSVEVPEDVETTPIL